MGLARAMELPTPMYMAENISVSSSKLICTDYTCKLVIHVVTAIIHFSLAVYVQNVVAVKEINNVVTFYPCFRDLFPLGQVC
jgi:low affinity Fe/Cu permease